MKICRKHDCVYNEKTGDCPECEKRLSDPLRINVSDIVSVETRGWTICLRGRVERICRDERGWLIYDLDNKRIMSITTPCVVKKLDETYKTARKC